jgi:hypothetical protein
MASLPCVNLSMKLWIKSLKAFSPEKRKDMEIGRT